jgi:pyruvate kinase
MVDVAPPSSAEIGLEPLPRTGEIPRLLADLERLCTALLQLEADCEESIRDTHAAFTESARNLVHYLALRRGDIRQIQEELAALGLSSLGRTESHVLAGVEAVRQALGRMAGIVSRPLPFRARTVGIAAGRELLRVHTDTLLGPPPGKRTVRIMVTMPSEAADDYGLVKQLLAGGMDCMRINCAHDDRAAWERMVAHLRRAQRELGRECRVLMDVAGPKLRTGPIAVETQVLKWGPQRDLHGRVANPAHIWITSAEQPEAPPAPADGTLRVALRLLAQLHGGRQVSFTDLRGKARSLKLERAFGRGRWAAASQTAYLRAGGVVQVRYHGNTAGQPLVSGAATVGAPPLSKQFITLKPGDPLLITKAPLPGKPAVWDGSSLVAPASIACTLPAIFGHVRAGESIWFDDGKIGGVIDSVEREVLQIRITVAKAAGSRLGADKGINLPDSDLRLPGLTQKDAADLSFIAKRADIVGLSFVKHVDDVRCVQRQLTELHAEHLGLILKIETREGFEQLPNLLLAAMRSDRIGVMIARGDLAVECGYERLAEVQEEMLWVCEAAHVPVIWATQVLENLAKKGVPSRAEITDAAMGERAECVMLNKGPHLPAALRVLDDILRRMEAHQNKKTARLRPLGISAHLVPARRNHGIAAADEKTGRTDPCEVVPRR